MVGWAMRAAWPGNFPVTRAPAAGAYRWSEAYGCFDGCWVHVHGLMARVPQEGGNRPGDTHSLLEYSDILGVSANPPYRLERFIVKKEDHPCRVYDHHHLALPPSH